MNKAIYLGESIRPKRSYTVISFIKSNTCKRINSFLIDALIIFLFNIFFVILVASLNAIPLKDVFSWDYTYRNMENIYFSLFFSAFLYYILMFYFFNKTLGCAVFGLRIEKFDDEPLGLKDCFIRFTGLLLSIMTFFIYDILIKIKGNKKFLQDIFSKTYLVEEYDRGEKAKY